MGIHGDPRAEPRPTDPTARNPDVADHPGDPVEPPRTVEACIRPATPGVHGENIPGAMGHPGPFGGPLGQACGMLVPGTRMEPNALLP
jgi:hypothetical protein